MAQEGLNSPSAEPSFRRDLSPRSDTPTVFQMSHSVAVSVLAKVEVLPLHAQVALLDRTWQDYPQWETGDEAVAYKAPSLIHPDTPPYPGFAVATRPDIENGQLQKVTVELWIDERPNDLRLVHRSTLAIGSAGVSVGNGQGEDRSIDLPRGDLPIEIYADSEESRSVSRVVFVLQPDGA